MNVEEENQACGCGCHTDVSAFGSAACGRCQHRHLKLLRDCLSTLQAEYKSLNNEYVHVQTQAASLKQKIHEMFEWVLKGSPDHKHDSKKECFFCEKSKEVLSILKENKIGDNIIKMLRQRKELLNAYDVNEKAKELKCEACDLQQLRDCSCQEIEEARMAADANLENLLQIIISQRI